VAPQFAECFEDGGTHVIREQGCIHSIMKLLFLKSVFVVTKNVFKPFPIAQYEEVFGETR